MTAKSDYLENKLLGHTLKVAAFVVPTNIYVALYTAAPSDTGGGTEVTGGSYTRQLCNGWAVPAAGTTSNTAAVNFGNMPACTVTHVALWDAITAGNLLYHGPLTASVAVAVTNTFQFAIGALDVTEA